MLSMVFFYIFDGRFENRQRSKAQKVHLQQAALLRMRAVIPGDQLLILREPYRHILTNLSRRNNNARSMNTGLPRTTIQRPCKAHHLLDLCIGMTKELLATLGRLPTLWRSS